MHFHSQNAGFQRFLKFQNLVFYNVRSTFFHRNRSQMQGNSVFRLLKSCCGSSSGVFPGEQKGSKSLFLSYFGPCSAFFGPFSASVGNPPRRSPKMAAGSPKRSPQQPQKPRLRPRRPEMSPKRLEKELPKKPKKG